MAKVNSTGQERTFREVVVSASPIVDLEVSSRLDLSFTATQDGPGIRSNWCVPHDRNGYWHDGIRVGRRYFAEIAELAAKDEHEAFYAILCAITSREWNHTQDGSGWGIEQGFSERLAAAAILGLRAVTSGAALFDPKREARHE
ncbi:hypothetical protein PWP93_04765 [Paraburkholderia sp. A1RI-2L]|uniref:hypothetical protein n=1 Tax=Paraburkholderia sp. A1RI-2L TaxID=3028367 RepID=UPI003B7E4D0F